MNRNLRNYMKQIFLFGVLLAVSACQQQGAKALYQAEVSKTLGTFVRGISTTYKKGANRGVRGVADYQGAWPTIWPSGYNYGSDPFNQGYSGVGQLYGGRLIQPNPYIRATECDTIAELGEASPNFQYNEQDYDLMLANLAKCLDALITERNPVMTYGNRNMGNYNFNQMGYATGYGMPVAFEGWGAPQMNQMNRFLQYGYY